MGIVNDIRCISCRPLIVAFAGIPRPVTPRDAGLSDRVERITGGYHRARRCEHYAVEEITAGNRPVQTKNSVVTVLFHCFHTPSLSLETSKCRIWAICIACSPKWFGSVETPKCVRRSLPRLSEPQVCSIYDRSNTHRLQMYTIFSTHVQTCGRPSHGALRRLVVLLWGRKPACSRLGTLGRCSRARIRKSANTTS